MKIESRKNVKEELELSQKYFQDSILQLFYCVGEFFSNLYDANVLPFLLLDTVSVDIL